VALTADSALDVRRPGRRPLWLSTLAVYSVLLGIITGIPQLYYVLFALDPRIFPIGPNANFLGYLWYAYILGGQQGGYLTVDPGTLAGGIEDAFMLGPLYVITGIGLWRLRAWVVPVGLITGSMIFYAILYFLLSGVLDPRASAIDIVTVVASSVPYLVYPLWLIPTLLYGRSLFVGGRDTKPAKDERQP
jgi:hypothetical protein